ncbi:nucleotidyltransferase family protein [Candidatus Parvarchaeota archaeon]|nr:nucleotidyltransferase family protein [Candidatus Parvarchaeota archaeon]
MVKQAIILAAGEGKRMKAGSFDAEILSTPKPLLKVGGVPIIEKNVKKLIENGFGVCIVVHEDNKKAFQEALKDYNVSYVIQKERLGTANALMAAKDFINDDLAIVLMGDDIIEYDLKQIKEADGPAVFGYEMDDVSGYGAIILDKDGYVKEIKEKQIKGKGFANTGVYIMHKDFLDIYSEIPKNEKSGEYYLTDAIGILYDRGVKFSFVKANFWMGINTQEQLSLARRGAF